MFPFKYFTRGPVLEPSISGLPFTRLIKHQGILLDQSSCVAAQQFLLTHVTGFFGEATRSSVQDPGLSSFATRSARFNEILWDLTAAPQRKERNIRYLRINGRWAETLFKFWVSTLLRDA